MVIMRHTPGAKSVTLDNLPPEAWRVIVGDTESESITKLYKDTPFLYRCVDIRSNAVSKLPRDIMRVGRDEPLDDEPDFLHNLNDLLYQTETALTLYGFAYLMKEATGLRWLAPKSIKPIYDDTEGLVGFERRVNNRPQKLSPDEVVYFWRPSLDAEVGPGTAPGEAVKNAAGVLNSTTLFSKMFFDRGAVYPILLTVEGNPPRDEMKKLENWWRRLFAGVTDAWKSVAIRADVKPQIIGPDPDKMAMTELTDTQRQEIAVALGVPFSVVMSNAANYATAQQDYLNLYDLTVIPEAERIAAVLNQQYLNMLGYDLKFKPEQLEVYQIRNLETGEKITTLVNGNILERDEGRDLLGYEALGEMEQEPQQPIIAQLPMMPEQQQDNTRRIHLEQWQRKATNRLKSSGIASCEFESDAIATIEREKIAHALAVCHSEAEIKNLFSEIEHSV